MLNLKKLQTLLYEGITSASGSVGEPNADALLSEIRGDERLSADQRIRIYGDAYFYRLLDCLKEDYPATLTVAGEPGFHDLVRSYLIEYPPTEPSIAFAGQYLAKFLSRHSLCKRWPFISELALLERELIEVFHDRDAALLTTEEVRAVDPRNWRDLRVRTHPTVRILECCWRVNDVRRTVDEGTAWREPLEQDLTLLVWRQATQVYYRELDGAEHSALESVRQGANFSAVCETFASRFEGDNPAVAITATLARWCDDGILVR
jgi:Putative DNA-binding domain